ncbi:MAG TPA: hypothetical protein VKX16_01660 [Chloroflexota bacterium]|nr:hypothetical protein [Chloroflexota bacterium]
METCECGAARRKFWIWRDSNNVLHASSFEPTSGTVKTVIAATARDALLPMTSTRPPKHRVEDADDPSQVWEGRCESTIAVAAG